MTDDIDDILLASLDSISEIPKIVFIVPYRDREQQKSFFMRQMAYVMEDYDPATYRIFFVHQRYEGSFNRGGMKNAGFLAVCDMYPNDWPNITFVFNDVDCMPYTKNFLPYETTYGVVKHFYGFKHTLGGIVSITGKTFVDAGTFPMFYAYGFEDNLLQQRVRQAGFQIDRSVFYSLYDRNILSFRDGVIRKVNRKEFDDYLLGKVTEGVHSIIDFKYVLQNEFIHVDKLDFGRKEDVDSMRDYDLRNGNAPFGNPIVAKEQEKQKVGMFRVFTASDKTPAAHHPKGFAKSKSVHFFGANAGAAAKTTSPAAVIHFHPKATMASLKQDGYMTSKKIHDSRVRAILMRRNSGNTTN